MSVSLSAHTGADLYHQAAEAYPLDEERRACKHNSLYPLFRAHGEFQSICPRVWTPIGRQDMHP